MEELAPDQVIASAVLVGSGTVRCAHGILPVPAPATAYILRDVPIYGGGIDGELCTPTGAALLRHFVTRFGDMPVMTLRAVGCGMGHKDFPRANCLRAMLGDTAADIGDVYELACNLDDMTGEDIAFAMERLLEAGALDVYTVPIGMKKSRPGVMLCVLCREEQREEMARLLLRHTTTLGVRESRHRRYTRWIHPGALWPGSCLRAGASGGRSRNMRTWPVLPGNRTCPWTRSVSRSGKQKASPMASP